MPIRPPRPILQNLPHAAAMILAVLVLFPGWLLKIDVLLHLGTPHAQTMPTTAFCLLLVALGAMAARSQPVAAQNFTRASLVAVFAVVVINLLVRLFVSPQGLDGWLPIVFRTDVAMSFGTAAMILLALFAHATTPPFTVPRDLRNGAAILGLSTMLGIVIFHSATNDHQIPLFSETSRSTALILGLLFLGALTRDMPITGDGEDYIDA